MRDKTVLLLNRVVHQFFRELDNMNSLKLHENITGQNMMVIGYLAHQKEAVYQKDLEEHFSVRRSTVSKVLRLMEEKGIIERHAVTSDARLKQIVLTSKGLEIHQTAAESVQVLTKELFRGVSEGELMLFNEILKKMEKNLNDGKDSKKVFNML